jgi:hypothetical protein
MKVKNRFTFPYIVKNLIGNDPEDVRLWGRGFFPKVNIWKLRKKSSERIVVLLYCSRKGKNG